MIIKGEAGVSLDNIMVKKDNHLKKMKMNVEPLMAQPACDSHVCAICGMQKTFTWLGTSRQAGRQINSNNKAVYKTVYKMPQNTHKAVR